MRPAQILLLAAVLTMSVACSGPPAVDDEFENSFATDTPADPQRLAEQQTTDFRQLCLSGATSAEEVFALARRSGWETYGVPGAMSDGDRPWALRISVKVSNTPAGLVCAVDHSAGDASVVMPLLWGNIGAPHPPAGARHTYRICSGGTLDGHDVEACSIDFFPHGMATELSTILAPSDAPQARQ